MERKFKKIKSGINKIILLLIFIISFGLMYDIILAPISVSSEQEIFPSEEKIISSENLRSSNAILIRLNDDTTLMRKNSEEKTYPASLTKMMTAIIAIERLPNLNQEIELTHETFTDLYNANASLAGFVTGEKIEAIDLLYAVLLPSGAEACIGIADYVAGSEEEFVKLMNEKALNLGMSNTNFSNSTGLQHENHYTTVEDMGKLLSYSMKNEIFHRIFTSSRHSTRPTNKHPDGITFHSTMFEKLRAIDMGNSNIIGGKTGYTQEAGLCLASVAQKDGMEYILITTGANGDQYSEQYNILDALTIYSEIGK
jgi:D-alanyl-D-alanine carboxypeptidase (penicillin-binding protein 5/6)